jgi:hypothetical protein
MANRLVLRINEKTPTLYLSLDTFSFIQHEHDHDTNTKSYYLMNQVGDECKVCWIFRRHSNYEAYTQISEYLSQQHRPISRIHTETVPVNLDTIPVIMHDRYFESYHLIEQTEANSYTILYHVHKREAAGTYARITDYLAKYQAQTPLPYEPRFILL